MNERPSAPASRSWRIHARKSDLARLQAYRVGEVLSDKTGREVEFSFRESLGDLNQTNPLWKMPEKGVFTEDFIGDLTEGRCDFVVHSWKDLPTEPRKETAIVATLERADARDLLLVRRDRLSEIERTGRIRVLTSSPRRAHNLNEFFKGYLPYRIDNVQFDNVRGNIPTRLRKLMSQETDALIVAKAAVDRLLLAPEAEFDDCREVVRNTVAACRFMILPLSLNPAAAAQGALAIEVAMTNQDGLKTLSALNSKETFQDVALERETLSSYGGGCHQKIGVTVLSRPYGQLMFLRGLTDAGEVLNKIELKRSSPEKTPVFAPEIFPKTGEETAFFDREPLAREGWAGEFSRASLLWVSRHTAWPEGESAPTDAVVWSAGLKTWRELAKRGIWVEGSAESLGEQEDLRLDALAPHAKSRALKLTHQASNDLVESGFAPCATYRLVPKANTPDLSGRTHFYWMSASSFARARELYPAIDKASHACGPGSTYNYLRRQLPPSSEISIFLSVEDFRRAWHGG